MLLIASLLFVAFVCAFSTRTAARTLQQTQRSLKALKGEVERQIDMDESLPADAGGRSPAPTYDDSSVEEENWNLPLGHDSRAEEKEVLSLVRDIFREGDAEPTAAFAELAAHAALLRTRIRTVGMGLVRAPFLSGVAATIFILATGGLSDAWSWVLVALGMSLVSTLVCQLLLSRARRASLAFSALLETLERERTRAAST